MKAINVTRELQLGYKSFPLYANLVRKEPHGAKIFTAAPHNEIWLTQLPCVGGSVTVRAKVKQMQIRTLVNDTQGGYA